MRRFLRGCFGIVVFLVGMCVISGVLFHKQQEAEQERRESMSPEQRAAEDKAKNDKASQIREENRLKDELRASVAKSFSAIDVDAVKIGMSYKEVLERLGLPNGVLYSQYVGHPQGRLAMILEWQEYQQRTEVWFVDGVVYDVWLNGKARRT